MVTPSTFSAGVEPASLPSCFIFNCLSLYVASWEVVDIVQEFSGVVYSIIEPNYNNLKDQHQIPKYLNAGMCLLSPTIVYSVIHSIMKRQPFIISTINIS